MSNFEYVSSLLEAKGWYLYEARISFSAGAFRSYLLACGSPSKGIRAPAWRKQLVRFENRPSRPNRGVIAIGRASRSADGL
jgi:hypothetical protein